MATLTATLEHEGQTYLAEPATIDQTMLGVEDHGIFTFILRCSGPGWGQGAGTYSLDTADPAPTDKPFKFGRVGTALGLSMIMEVMRVVGVSEWEAVKGKRVLVLRESRGDAIRGIADPDAQRVVIFKDFFDAFHDRPTHRRYVDGRDDL